jgi:dolichyl-phosphate beta-glucosyltransferase
LARRSFGEASEVVIVDDGSRDGTREAIESEMPRFEAAGIPLRLLGDGKNRGKGASVRMGMLTAVGQVVLFSDADLSSPIEEAPKLVGPILAGDVAIAIGSRGLDYEMIGVHQTLARELAGRTFNLAMRIVLGLPFKDTQCGFKAFRRDAARAIFSRVRTEGFGFDAESLSLARTVVWNNVEGTKVSLLGGLRPFGDLLLIRFNDLRGLYGGRAIPAPSVSSLVK